MPTYKTKMSDPNGSSQQNVLGTNSEKTKVISLPFFFNISSDTCQASAIVAAVTG